MDKLQNIFKYQGQQVRTIVKNDEPWFLAKDVCEILDIKNHRDAINRLDQDEKGVVLTDTPGGRQELATVNEYGLYSLVLGSRKPEAKSFKRWITHEVIPSIRKTGQYIVDQPKNEAKQKRDEVMLINARTRQGKAMAQIAKQFKDILAPESVHLLVAGATEALMGKPLLPKPEVPVLFTATEIGVEYGVSAQKIGRLANKHGVKTSEYGKWVLDKAKHSDKQIQSFLYNEKGRQKLIELIQEEKSA